MNERTQRILLITVFILTVVGLGAGLYFMFFRAEPTEVVVPDLIPDEGLPEGFFPDAGEAGDRVVPAAPTDGGLVEAEEVARGGVTEVTTLTTGRVTNTTIAANGRNAQYYDPNDGRFYRIDDEGEVVQLSSQRFPNAENVAWNNESDKALIEFPDGSNVIYDFNSQQQVTLPRHWEDFAFSPASDEIVAKSLGIDENNRWLVTSSTDGSNVKAVQALGGNADKVTVAPSPNDRVIAFADTAPPVSGGVDRKMILPLGKENENYRGLIVEGFDFRPNWSTDGKQLLYSVAGSISENKPLLWITDASPASMGENRRSLALNTWADKCTFSSPNTIYCAVPQFLSPNVGLQPALAATTPDSLYKVDLTSGRSTLLAIPETATTMTSLQVTGGEDTLYYTNAATGALETIRLK